MILLSSFEHFYYSFDIAVGFLLCFWVRQFFSNLRISAKICKNSADLHRFAKIEPGCDAEPNFFFERKNQAHLVPRYYCFLSIKFHYRFLLVEASF